MKKVKRKIFILTLLLLMILSTNVNAAQKSSVTLYKGQTFKLKVTGANSKKISWSSSNKSVATVKNGTVTAKKAGTAIVQAKFGKTKRQCKVIVKNPTISMTPKSKTIKVEETLRLKTVIQGNSQNVTWKSGNNAIASVNAKGVVSAKKVGTVTITAKANGVSARCKITVQKRPIDKNKIKNAKAEYSKYLSGSEDFDYQFAMADVYGDATPELITIAGGSMMKALTVYEYDSSFKNHMVLLGSGDKVYINKQKKYIIQYYDAINYLTGKKDYRACSYCVIDLETYNIIREYKKETDGSTYLQKYGGKKEKLGANEWKNELNKYLNGCVCYTKDNVKLYKNNATNRKKYLS